MLCHAVAAAAHERLLAAGFNFHEKPNVWRWAAPTAHATAPNHVPAHCTQFDILITRVAQADSSPISIERRLSTSKRRRSRALAAGQRVRELGTRSPYPFRSAPRTSRASHAPRGLTGFSRRRLAPFRSIPRPLPQASFSHVIQPPASPPLQPILPSYALMSGSGACAGAVATMATRCDDVATIWRRPATTASGGVRELRRKGRPTRPSCRTSSATASAACQLGSGTARVRRRAVRAVRSRLVVWWL